VTSVSRTIRTELLLSAVGKTPFAYTSIYYNALFFNYKKYIDMIVRFTQVAMGRANNE